MHRKTPFHAAALALFILIIVNRLVDKPSGNPGPPFVLLVQCPIKGAHLYMAVQLCAKVRTRKRLHYICANLGIPLFCATLLRTRRWISALASICHTNTTNLTVRWGGDRRWTLQQIAGLPEVLRLIKQMPGGIISAHRRGKWQSSGEV